MHFHSGATETLAARLRRKNGSSRCVEVQVGLLENGERRLDYGSSRMSTELNSRAMSHETLDIRTIFDTISEGLVVQSRGGRIIDANPAAARILGLSREQLLRKTSMDLDWHAIREDGTPFPSSEHPAMTTLRTGDSTRNQIMGLRLQNSDLRWISINSQAIYGKDNAVPNAVIITFVDITERQAAAAATTTALAAKEVLLREIHHRMKNNMQAISSLLRLQSNRLHDAKYVAMFRQAEERIHSMALVHEQLHRSPSPEAIDFAEYLADLAKLIVRSRRSGTTRINVHKDCDSVRVAIEIAVPLGLIANELMTNVFKHAFPGRRIGNLWLRLKRNGEQTLCFTVTDDGVGLPPEFHFDTTGSAGLYIVKNLVRQLRATLSFDEVPSGGASIAVCLNSPAHS